MTEEPLLPTPTSNQPGGSAEQHLVRKRRMKGGPRNTVTDLRMKLDQLSSASSPVSEDSTSPSNRLGGCLSVRSRSMSGAAASSPDTGRLFPVVPQSRTFDRNVPTPTAQDFISRKSTSSEVLNYETGKSVTLDRWAEWISSAEGSPASQSATPASGRLRPTPAGSGPSSEELLGRFNPDGSFLKMCPDSSVQESLPGLPSVASSLTWPRSGSMHDGHVYEHQMSVPPIDGRGSSSLPTPTAGEAKNARNATAGRQPGSRHHSGTTLSDWATLLPTPTTRDWKDGRDPSENVPSNGLLGRVIPRLLPTPRYEGYDAGNHRGQPDGLPQTIKRHLGDHTNPPSEDGSR